MSVPNKFSTVNLVPNISELNGYFQILKDRWWWCVEGNPEFGIMYEKYYPQCNKVKAISAKTFHSVKVAFPSAELVFVQTSVIPYKCECD